MTILFKFTSNVTDDVQQAVMALLESHGFVARRLYEKAHRPAMKLVYTVPAASSPEEVEGLLESFKSTIEYVERAPDRRPLGA